MDLSRAGLNVHYKSCEGTYLAAFDRMVESGAISTWNLKPDSKIVDEFVFDVNTEYFDRRGGYEYAKRFYEDAYHFAAREAGGEEYILSAVMHADERNKALSEQLGRDVYHYHLHVMYLPVVDKEIKWSKRCKDPALVGTVKCVVKQVNNSKRWESEMVVGADGKRRLAYSYSALQDRFQQYMQAAGYDDIQRGQRGSTAEHLDVLDYKIQQDTQRVAALEQDVQAKQKQSAVLDKKLVVKEKAASDLSMLDAIGKKNLVGQTVLTPEELKSVKAIVKKEAKAQEKISELKGQLAAATSEAGRLKKDLEKYRGRSMTDTMKFYQAQARAPRRMADVIADILRQSPERSEHERNQPQHQRSESHSR